MAGINFGKQKHDRELRRRERKLAKQERVRIRRAAKLNGVEIETLPEAWRGVAKTLATGDNNDRT